MGATGRLTADVREIHLRQRLNRGVPGRLSDADRWGSSVYRVRMHVWMTVVRPVAPCGGWRVAGTVKTLGRPSTVGACHAFERAVQTRPRVTSPRMYTSPVSTASSRRTRPAVRAGSCWVRRRGCHWFREPIGHTRVSCCPSGPTPSHLPLHPPPARVARIAAVYTAREGTDLWGDLACERYRRKTDRALLCARERRQRCTAC
jgi:hypothetical protein